MARKFKYQAIAISLRIPEDKERNYLRLIHAIYNLKRSVQVYSHTGMAITQFNKKNGNGVISKFSIIDTDGDWFDENGFGPASEDDLKKISIPGNLRPNLLSKPFSLDADNHILAVMTYSSGSGISPSQIEKYFKAVVEAEEIAREFGKVQVDIFKNSTAIDEMLDLETLREITITISRPNHIPPGLIKEIEERLAEEKADKLRRTISTSDADYLLPNNTTRALGAMAAENGSVIVRYEQNGTILSANSEQKPHIETLRTEDTESTESGFLEKLKVKIVNAVKQNRQKVDRLAEE